MSEAEVALKLANYMLRNFELAVEGYVSIDGAAARQFDIYAHLMATGWLQTEQRGKNSWSGIFQRDMQTLRVHTRPGEADVMIPLGERRLVAECKKGPLIKSRNGVERRLFSEAVGQACKWQAKPGDVVIVAVPNTVEFLRQGRQWLESSLFARTGIQIVFVGQDNVVHWLRSAPSELVALNPTILLHFFNGDA